MNKAKKMIVSGLAGLTLLTGGFAAGATVYNTEWVNHENIENVKSDLTNLDSLITKKNGEISDLEEQKNLLESDLATIESGVQKLVSEIIPGIADLPTRQQLVEAAEWVQNNPKNLPSQFESVLVSLENDLGITKKRNHTIGKRLNIVIAKYKTINEQLGSNNVKLYEANQKLYEANQKISELENTGSTKDDEISVLKQELEQANDDAFGLKDHSAGIVKKYKTEIEAMKSEKE